MKKDMGRKLPLLEWQFLMMKHNEHEINEARRRYKELGFDSIFFPKINLPHNENDPRLAEEWLPLDSKRRPIFNYDKADNVPGCCWWLWRTTVINHDGGVSPCCYIDDKMSDLGNISYDSFENIWKGELYRSARNLFSSNDHKALKTTICCSCNVVKRWKRKTC
jgi:radical SAM protein with 4Fe4S-binding SPASM domain